MTKTKWSKWDKDKQTAADNLFLLVKLHMAWPVRKSPTCSKAWQSPGESGPGWLQEVFERDSRAGFTAWPQHLHRKRWEDFPRQLVQVHKKVRKLNTFEIKTLLNKQTKNARKMLHQKLLYAWEKRSCGCLRIMALYRTWEVVPVTHEDEWMQRIIKKLSGGGAEYWLLHYKQLKWC